MSLRGRILVGFISLFCFCLGITATVLMSPSRSFSAALPHPRARVVRYRVSENRWHGCSNSTSEQSEQNADKEMSRTISGIIGVADHQTLDKLQVQVEQLESNGRAFLGVYLGSGSYGAIVQYTEDMTPAATAFRRGDAIVSVGGLAVTDSDSLRRVLLTIEPGTPVTIGYYRDGSLEQTTIRPMARPVGQLPLSHRALGFAYAGIGKNADAVKQLESYRRQSPYSGDDEAVRNMISNLR